MKLVLILVIILAAILLFLLFLDFLDVMKKRKVTRRPFLSFVMSCYNDGESVEATVESIIASYDRKKCEIIIVDDKSQDGSLKTMEGLKKKHHFTLIANRENRGKAYSLNKASRLAKSGILFFLDTDVTVTSRIVEDVLARLEDAKVAAVSAPYRPKNHEPIAVMQEIEYNLSFMTKGAYNIFSTISIWGGCVAVKKEAFEKMGGWSENSICEDTDLAFKLNKAGYRVEQSFYPLKTDVPGSVSSWYRQKIRWRAGEAQSAFTHASSWVRNPLYLACQVLFAFLSVVVLLSVVWALVQWSVWHSGNPGEAVASALLFCMFAVPFVLPMITRLKDVYKLLYAIPFSLLYMPLFSVNAVHGLLVGVGKYRSLRDAKRGW